MGVDDDLLLSGNFDTKTLNLPDLEDLETTLEKIAASGGVAKERNVIFQNRGILMSVNKVFDSFLFKFSAYFYSFFFFSLHTKRTPCLN